MPQMAPLSWLLLFIIFSITLIIFNTFNYFSYFPNKSQNYSKFKNNSLYLMNWKW